MLDGTSRKSIYARLSSKQRNCQWQCGYSCTFSFKICMQMRVFPYLYVLELFSCILMIVNNILLIHVKYLMEILYVD